MEGTVDCESLPMTPSLFCCVRVLLLCMLMDVFVGILGPNPACKCSPLHAVCKCRNVRAYNAAKPPFGEHHPHKIKPKPKPELAFRCGLFGAFGLRCACMSPTSQFPPQCVHAAVARAISRRMEVRALTIRQGCLLQEFLEA